MAPARYASLSHPGDSFSYDMFSQAGKAVRDDAAQMLGGLTPRSLIAIGHSQSAARLVTYIDAVHPLAGVYDGFYVQGRGAAGAPLSQAPQPSVPAPTPTMIRKADVPVFVVETETDVARSALFDRQPDTRRFRLWEIAGTSHFDFYDLEIGPGDTANGQGAVQNLAAMQNPPANPAGPPPPGFECAQPINTGGSHWVVSAAIFWLNKWVADGIQPPRAPLLEASTAPGVLPAGFVRDANGIARGGVRTPQVDAPIATLTGVGNGPGTSPPSPFSGNCVLFGTTVPFSASQIHGLYDSHRDFVRRWDRAVREGVKEGFILRPDAAELKASAANSNIGR
jgi:hypothetical protein